MAKWDNKNTEKLLNIVLRLQNMREAKKFFRDLFTEPEIMEFAKRWQVVTMLNAKIPYTEIQKKTGMSSTTVARISKWLNGSMGGYRLMLEKTKKK